MCNLFAFNWVIILRLFNPSYLQNVPLGEQTTAAGLTGFHQSGLTQLLASARRHVQYAVCGKNQEISGFFHFFLQISWWKTNLFLCTEHHCSSTSLKCWRLPTKAALITGSYCPAGSFWVLLSLFWLLVGRFACCIYRWRFYTNSDSCDFSFYISSDYLQ